MGSAARILIVDDHPIVREGLGMAVRAAQAGVVIDVAGNIAEAEILIERHRGYQLAIIDMDLPDAEGFSGFLRVQHALGSVPVALFGQCSRRETIEAARAIGAAGLLCKADDVDALVERVRALLRGSSIFPESAGISRRVQAARDVLSGLSGAQLRTVLAMADGSSNKQIAGDLGVTEATVKAHLTASFRKLGVHNRMQAMLAVQPLVSRPSTS